MLIRSHEVGSAIEHLRRFENAPQGWLDKIALVWVLQDGGVAPEVPQDRRFTTRQFNISESPLPHPWGRLHLTGMERLVHYLRGVRIGVALGGGAARGMAHLGVLKALEDNGIVPDVIVGTSVGAMAGILYSAGLDCDYLADEFATKLNPPWIFRQLPNGGYWYLLYNYRWSQFEPMLREQLRERDFVFPGLRKLRPEFCHPPLQSNFSLLQDMEETCAPETFRGRPKKNERVARPWRLARRVAVAALQLQHRRTVLPDRNGRAQFAKAGKVFRKE